MSSPALRLSKSAIWEHRGRVSCEHLGDKGGIQSLVCGPSACCSWYFLDAHSISLIKKGQKRHEKIPQVRAVLNRRSSVSLWRGKKKSEGLRNKAHTTFKEERFVQILLLQGPWTSNIPRKPAGSAAPQCSSFQQNAWFTGCVQACKERIN